MYSKAKASKKKTFDLLQRALFWLARKLGILSSQSRDSKGRNWELIEGIADSTGLETRYVSQYYAFKKAKMRQKSIILIWEPRLTILCHSQSHLIVTVRFHRDARSENIDLIPLVRESKTFIHFERVMADKGFDSEKNHRVLHEDLGIPSVIIPPRVDGINKYWKRIQPNRRIRCHAPYRHRIRKYFPKQKYRNRCQVESVFSRLKRRLGSALQARTSLTQLAECYLRVLTYNLLLIAAD